MHDAVKLEGAGLPTAVIVQDGFKQLALMKRKHMGLEEIEPVIIPGILGNKEIASGKGESAVAEIVQWITKGPAKPQARPIAAALR